MKQSKKAYESPLVEIILFDNEDVIATSGEGNTPVVPDDDNWGQWDPKSPIM